MPSISDTPKASRLDLRLRKLSLQRFGAHFLQVWWGKFSKQIARKIEQARQVKPIETTTELAEIIKSAKPAKELKKKGHPAKQIFQAIRIEVNDELGAADESIQEALDLLAVDGRISVITFHSLEDRLTR